MASKSQEESFDKLFKYPQNRIPWNANDNNPCGTFGWISCHIGEIKIEGYKTALLVATHIVEASIRLPFEILIPNSMDFVPSRDDTLLGTFSEVVV
jgi:hypothetical protein